MKASYQMAARLPKAGHSAWRGYWKYRYLTLLLIPVIAYFIIFKYMPIYGLSIAFKDFKILQGINGSEWNGLVTFEKLFSKPNFWLVFRNTVIIGAYQFIFGFPAPIIFALLLNEVRNSRFKKTVQTISYLPHFVSWVVLAGLFTQFLSPSTGPINRLIMQMGGTPIYFLADKSWFRSILVITNIWKSIGWGSIIYLAALSNVDPELYEAAEIDGAGRLCKALHITLPSIMPIVTIMLIMQSGKLLSDNFDQVFNLYNPAVYEVADVISTYTYREGIGSMQYSYATAVGLFKNVISFAMVLGTNWISKHVNEYGIW